MTNFQSFTEDGQTFWVEIEQPVKKQPGEVQVSISASQARQAVAAVQVGLSAALNVVKVNAIAFIDKVKEIPDPPDEVQVTFGLIATGDVSVPLAIAKAGVGAGYAVTLIWRRDKSNPAQTTQTNMLQIPGSGI